MDTVKEVWQHMSSFHKSITTTTRLEDETLEQKYLQPTNEPNVIARRKDDDTYLQIPTKHKMVATPSKFEDVPATLRSFIKHKRKIDTKYEDLLFKLDVLLF